MGEQRTLSRRPDPRQAVENRLGHRAVAALSMVGDREPVSLVAQRWSSCSSGVSCGRASGDARPGMNTSSMRFASETTSDPALAKALKRAQARG